MLWWTSRAFDEAYYLENNSDVAEAGDEPLEHFLVHGQPEGRRGRPESWMETIVARIANIFNILRDEGLVQPLRNGWNFLKSQGLRNSFSRLDVVGKVQSGSYSEWIQKYDTLNDAGRKQISEKIAAFDRKPLISIVMPTYNTNTTWLEQAVDSVCAQLYPNWELCIADDCSTEPDVINYLKSLDNKDERIKVAFRSENGHISKASNTALSLCTGEWVALLDHDDLLPEDALFWVADTIARDDTVKLIYSDEDKLDENGERVDPYFKCDWNRDLFYSQNMISHLGVYKRQILHNIGGFRAGYEGSQDHDLALRYIENIDEESIRHIPRILYHWRAHDESTAKQRSSKPYAATAGEKAIRDHFDRCGIKADVQWSNVGYRVAYQLENPVPRVSIIIPTRNGLELIKQCIESVISKTSYPDFEIIVIDNGSDDPLVLKYFDDICSEDIRIIVDSGPFNFSALNNRAVESATGEIIVLMNNDIEVISADWLSEMVSIAIQNGVGAVGAKLYYPDNTLQHCGVVLGIGGIANHAYCGESGVHPGYFGRAQLINGYSAVTGACLAVRKSAYVKVGGLNETDLAVAFNDVDFCLRLKEEGYRNVWTPHAELYHHESATRGADDTPEKWNRFRLEVEYMESRWGDALLEDTAYNPNLALNTSCCDLAFPPRIEAVNLSERVVEEGLTHA